MNRPLFPTTLSIPPYYREVGQAKDLSTPLIKHMGGDEKTDQICAHDVKKKLLDFISFSF